VDAGKTQRRNMYYRLYFSKEASGNADIGQVEENWKTNIIILLCVLEGNFI